jgi:uncharacterized membrane protein
MNWKSRYLAKSYLRSSLWIVPIGAMIAEIIVAPAVHVFDAYHGWQFLGFGIEGAKVVAGTVITFSLSFIVFTFGSLLVAVQVASGQYTPRIIATTLLNNNVIRFTVGLFVFTLLFAVKALNQTETSVPQFAILITGLLGLICLAAFLYLIDYAARLLRPVSLVRHVGEEGLSVLRSVYPEILDPAVSRSLVKRPDTDLRRTIFHQANSEIVLAVNASLLLAQAEKVGGIIELVPKVGDFVGRDEPVFRLYGDAAQINDQSLLGAVIFGSERTLEQDPLFAGRILVDIALKALSAAINDPTTAVLAIDQLHRLLRAAGRRRLHTDYIQNRRGELRVIFRTPNWDDFVQLAFTEIRFCGAHSIQVARRLRAMLVNLANTLPSIRHPALHREAELLDRAIEKFYTFEEDLAIARIPDSQGLGGSTEIPVEGWAA